MKSSAKPRISEEIILDKTNDLLRDAELPEIEKIRTRIVLVGGNWKRCVELNVWVKGIANHFVCLYEKSAGEKNVDFISNVPRFMLKPLRKALKILSYQIEEETGKDFDGWGELPNK